MESNVKKVLVLWAKWMLWNAIFSYLKEKDNLKVIWTSSKAEDWLYQIIIGQDYIDNLDVLFSQNSFDYVINCIWVIRPKSNDLDDYKKTLIVNAHFPKTLQKFSYKFNYKLIHFSTDCVFDWKKWLYTLEDIPNEFEIYGLSKYLWEINDNKNLTIRTSILWVEQNNNSRNLLNWFLSNKDWSEISWYPYAKWNWLTTLTIAKIIEKIIMEDIDITWLVQFWWENTSKYDLLLLFNEIFWKKLIIKPDITVKSNKIIIPSEEQMLFDKIISPLKSQINDLKEFYNL